MVDPGQGKVIFRAVLVQRCEVHTHPKDFGVLFRDQDWVGNPSGLLDFPNKVGFG